MEVFIQFINQLKWHLPIKCLIGVFVLFVNLHMEVFLKHVTMLLQLLIQHEEPKILGFTIFIYQHWQEPKYTINMSFCSFYLAPYKIILVGCAKVTIG